MMKKRVFVSVLGIALVFLSILGVNLNIEKSDKDVLLLSNLEAIACEMLEGDVATGKGTWCNCSDMSVFCGTKDFPKRDIYGVKEQRN